MAAELIEDYNFKDFEKLKTDVDNLSYQIEDIEFLIKRSIDDENIAITSLLLKKANINELKFYSNYAEKKEKIKILQEIKRMIDRNPENINKLLNMGDNPFIRKAIESFLDKFYNGIKYTDLNNEEKVLIIKKVLNRLDLEK